MDLENCFSDEVKAALALLTAGGFTPLTDVQIEDCRELGTGLRRRTFRNQGRYALCLCLRDLPPVPEEAIADQGPKRKPAADKD